MIRDDYITNDCTYTKLCQYISEGLQCELLVMLCYDCQNYTLAKPCYQSLLLKSHIAEMPSDVTHLFYML